jgi:CRISPR-associated protein Cas2
MHRIDWFVIFGYHEPMFVSVICDMGNEDSRSAFYNLLPQYGFERVQKACFECASITEKSLSALKRDIDKITDSYDTVRLYQYPVEGTFAITILKENKWRRIVVRDPARPRE